MPQTFMPPFWLNAMCLFFSCLSYRRRNLCKNETKTFAFSCFFSHGTRLECGNSAMQKEWGKPFFIPFFLLLRTGKSCGRDAFSIRVYRYIVVEAILFSPSPFLFMAEGYRGILRE